MAASGGHWKTGVFVAAGNSNKMSGHAQNREDAMRRVDEAPNEKFRQTLASQWKEGITRMRQRQAVLRRQMGQAQNVASYDSSEARRFMAQKEVTRIKGDLAYFDRAIKDNQYAIQYSRKR